MEKEQLRDNRKMDYYREVFFNNDIQFEVKLNNIGTYFLDKYKQLWRKLYRINKKEEVRVFPLSNWTETDIWQYIRRENIEIPSLYFAKVRPVVYRDGNIIMVDDDRMKLLPGEKVEHKSVRFRTLGCYPLTGGCESTATTLDEIIDETLSAVSSERTTRVIDNEAAGSMERRKREGYF